MLPKSLQEIVSILKLSENDPVRYNINKIIAYTAADVVPFPEYKGINAADDIIHSLLIQRSEGKIHRVDQEIEKILNIAAKGKGEEYKGNKPREYLIEMNDTLQIWAYGKPPQQPGLGAQDILDLGFLPQGCVSYATLAHGLCSHVGIESKVILMQNPGLHAVLDYKTKDGWKRCDPKWENRRDIIFFGHEPLEYERFKHDRLAIHGGKWDGKKYLRYQEEIVLFS